MFGRSRFAQLIDTQLDLFVREHADVVEDARARLEAYNRAERDEAEELYGDYRDALAAGSELLEGLRDHYARSLDESAAEQYVAAFDRAVRRRLPAFGLELDG